MWPPRTHAMHVQHVSEVRAALTATRQSELEKVYGVHYSELLRLSYIDIIEHHVVDPMHNFLLGTAKHVMSICRDKRVLNCVQYELIQEKGGQNVPPFKNGQNSSQNRITFLSFTADQWRNWMCVLYLLPS